MEKIRLTVAELDEVVCDDHAEYAVVYTQIIGTFRHGNDNEAVIKRLSDGKFFRVPYRDSVKETCEFMDLNSDGEYSEVVPVEVTVTVYQTAP